ncbi:hypothetical protein GALL_146010 [mine drainage metagenome]|uniref:Uncharacterized protein n=1 Tax=mine drainage metagenome TaxID=410659 RepID=A0A1J5S4F8_9ZZZZ
MKMVSFILSLSLSLLAAPVLAQESNTPGKENPNGMSDQDYLIQRERILKRMKATSTLQSQQTRKQEGNVKREPVHDSAYGQGYGSRKNAKDANNDSNANIEGSRPERPQRPERPPHIDRPGRP